MEDLLAGALKPEYRVATFPDLSIERVVEKSVDYPMDLLVYPANSKVMHEFRLYKNDLFEISEWWQERLRNSVNEIPAKKLDEILAQIYSA